VLYYNSHVNGTNPTLTLTRCVQSIFAGLTAFGTTSIFHTPKYNLRMPPPLTLHVDIYSVNMVVRDRPLTDQEIYQKGAKMAMREGHMQT